MEPQRKLASVQRIIALHPIDGAERIERAQVLGWNVVVQKGLHQVGDKIVYIEIDSILPDRPEFAELAGKRIKTVKLRGTISQGIVYPYEILRGRKYPSDIRADVLYDLKDGTDVTTLMGVTKYEPFIPAELAGVVKGPFPSFIPRTDEMRIQSYPKALHRNPLAMMYVTEKLDGTSVTVYKRNGELGCCSRNIELAESETVSIWRYAKKVGLSEKIDNNVALQGEMVGPGIQGNKYGLKEVMVFWFNMYDIEVGRYINYISAKMWIENHGLLFVPILGMYPFNARSVEGWVQESIGTSALNSVQREGIVIRSVEEVQDEELGRLSVKAINPKFLLKFEE